MEDSILKPLIPRLEAVIDRTLERERVPGAAIGIVRDQEHLWSRGFGYADLASDRFPNADTVFRCGSITKTFTATAIMQLREEGKLGIDDPLVRPIPEFGAVKARFGKPQDVTIRRLLTHTSGLAGEGPNNGWEKLEFPSIEGMLSALGRTEIVIEAESQYKYSNLGYALLGEVIARVSGQPYADYVQRNLLDPLGMNDSGFHLPTCFCPRQRHTRECHDRRKRCYLMRSDRLGSRIRTALIMVQTSPPSGGRLL